MRLILLCPLCYTASSRDNNRTNTYVLQCENAEHVKGLYYTDTDIRPFGSIDRSAGSMESECNNLVKSV